MQTHLKRPWSWERLTAGGEGDIGGWGGWMASPTEWTWVWVNSARWWWTGRPGVLQFMGLQWVGYNWVNELKYLEGGETDPFIHYWYTLERKLIVSKEGEEAAPIPCSSSLILLIDLYPRAIFLNNGFVVVTNGGHYWIDARDTTHSWYVKIMLPHVQWLLNILLDTHLSDQKEKLRPDIN